MDMRLHPFSRLIILSMLTLLLSACGRISVDVTDAPVDLAEEVVIVFTGLELQSDNGDTVELEFDQPKAINLLAFSDDLSANLLDDKAIEQGSYTSIKMNIDIAESYIRIDGADHELRIPAGDESGLTITGDIEIKPGATSEWVIDFDLRKSLFEPEGADPDYVLRPTLRLVDRSVAGSVAGTIDQSLLSLHPACFDQGGDVNAALYIFKGHDITPDDVDGTAPDLYTSVKVKTDFNYNKQFLEEGDYTVALTCEADLDEPGVDNTLNFIQSSNIVITALSESALDFSL